jgi:hypothetical protein
VKLHQRTQIIAKARLELGSLLLKLEEENELTIGEILDILNGLASDYIRSLVRMERHPNDPDKKGDEA